jgi:hypothetical protein
VRPAVGAEWAAVIEQEVLDHLAGHQQAPAAPAYPTIADLDRWLSEVMEGQPRVPKRYELHCHPDVIVAIMQACPPPDYPPQPWSGTGLYGGAEVIAKPELGSGAWEMYLNGELVNSGTIGGEEK